MNPTLDIRNTTAEFGAELALSALGKGILYEVGADLQSGLCSHLARSISSISSITPIHLPHREVERLIGRHVDARILQQLDRILRRAGPEERQIALPRLHVAGSTFSDSASAAVNDVAY